MPPNRGNKNQSETIKYPTGVKEINDELGTDELVRRLKQCASAFQAMGQDDSNENDQFKPLAMLLAQDTYMEHTSKDVRLLIACCIADVFRVFAPDAPYQEQEHLKNIFYFLIKQLKGLADPKDPAFKRYFYLLENLAWVKSFNICFELEDNQGIFCQLFQLMFSIINDDHSAKVKNIMLDMLCPLIVESETMSQELLDVILAQIVEPRKSQNKNSYNLAKDILKKTAESIETYIKNFFNSALILGKTSQSNIVHRLYDLIYELQDISPLTLISVFPQLEFKLKSGEQKERLDVTRLLARMFSDKDTKLATDYPTLWSCFLGRFNDIDVQIRIRCVQYSMHFLLNHPELRTDVTEQLRLRQHDPDENVRYEVVLAIISAAKKDFSSVNENLLTFVKERTLDKKFRIRREALLGLAMIYKQIINDEAVPQSTKNVVSWVKNKVLHVYYQNALEDRLLVERILNTCLVPFQLTSKDRMAKLYELYSSIDDHGVKAFNELFRCQKQVRTLLESLMELHASEQKEHVHNFAEENKLRVAQLAKCLPDHLKAMEYITKFSTLIGSNPIVRSNMEEMLTATDYKCETVYNNVKEVLKKLGNQVMSNLFYVTVKSLLERAAPLMIDSGTIRDLIQLIEADIVAEEPGSNDKENLQPDEQGSVKCRIESDEELQKKVERGLKLLLALTSGFTPCFQHADIIYRFIDFLVLYRLEFIGEIVMQILSVIAVNIEENHPGEETVKLIAVLQDFALNGTGRQPKNAVKCLSVIARNKETVLGSVLEAFKEHLMLSSEHLRTALISIGHMAYECPHLFGQQVKAIVSKNIVKDLLMKNEDDTSGSLDNTFCQYEVLSNESKAKIEGLKLMVRWLLGSKGASISSASSAFRLLFTLLQHEGDLMNSGKMSQSEKAWLRLYGSTSVLKLCCEPKYLELLTSEQFQQLALTIQDECHDVRSQFARKLHKGLNNMKLPVQFMSIFALAASEVNRELRVHVKQFILANITKRREYVKQMNGVELTSDWRLVNLPDYALPHVIYLLAHDPSYKAYNNLKALQVIKENMWFLLEPLMTKNENYSFGFFKRIVESIKHARDLQCQDDEAQNRKLYAVCDIALGLLMSKTTNFTLKDFPPDPKLPKKLFTEVNWELRNNKCYLPPEMQFTQPKRINLDMWETDKAKEAEGDKEPASSPPAGARQPAAANRGRGGVRVARPPPKVTKLPTTNETDNGEADEATEGDPKLANGDDEMADLVAKTLSETEVPEEYVLPVAGERDISDVNQLDEDNAFAEEVTVESQPVVSPKKAAPAQKIVVMRSGNRSSPANKSNAKPASPVKTTPNNANNSAPVRTTRSGAAQSSESATSGDSQAEASSEVGQEEPKDTLKRRQTEESSDETQTKKTKPEPRSSRRRNSGMSNGTNDKDENTSSQEPMETDSSSEVTAHTPVEAKRTTTRQVAKQVESTSGSDTEGKAAGGAADKAADTRKSVRTQKTSSGSDTEKSSQPVAASTRPKRR